MIDHDEHIETTKHDTLYVRKFSLNEAKLPNRDIVPGFPLNKKMNYDQAKMIQAIQNGMIILIRYKGEEDERNKGGERTIVPLVLGVNKNTKNTLLRIWHLEGFSVRMNRYAQKVFRLLDVKNISSMEFIGDFYRNSPKGYRMNDRHMTSKIIASADFNVIRKNQDKLLRDGKIQVAEDTQLNNENVISKIRVSDSKIVLNLINAWDNEILNKYEKNPKNVKITILKTIIGNNVMAVFGALSIIGRSVKVFEKKNLLGTYKVIDTFTGDEFNDHKRVKGKSDFPIYIFEEKLK
jgi:hypothetical protein